jgi:hypothetical protein
MENKLRVLVSVSVLEQFKCRNEILVWSAPAENSEVRIQESGARIGGRRRYRLFFR